MFHSEFTFSLRKALCDFSEEELLGVFVPYLLKLLSLKPDQAVFDLLQNLKDVLADLIPKEQSRIKSFRQQHGKTNIGQITVDMVSETSVIIILQSVQLAMTISNTVQNNVFQLHCRLVNVYGHYFIYVSYDISPVSVAQQA